MVGCGSLPAEDVRDEERERISAVREDGLRNIVGRKSVVFVFSDVTGQL